MSKRIWIIAGFAVAAAAGWWTPCVAVAQEPPIASPAKNLRDAAPPPGAGLPQLTLTRNGHSVHILPTVKGAAALAKALADRGPLRYNGGPIMRNPALYAIFWLPPALQNGGPTNFPVHNAIVNFGIDNNNTQYFDVVGSTTNYILNSGSLGGFAIDTSPYPASGCADAATPGNCITDAQIEAEIQKVMSSKGWTGGPNNIFLLYTSSGEGSCFDSGSTSCAYTQYCAYHSFIGTPSPIIYANMPFGNLSVCQVPGQPSPNGDALADAVTSTASHEISEAITDPLLNAWFTALGNEIGDLCAYNYGTNTWDAGNANQMWNGTFYELQQEFNNHVAACSQVGP
jgi:hypothetical protein